MGIFGAVGSVLWGQVGDVTDAGSDPVAPSLDADRSAAQGDEPMNSSAVMPEACAAASRRCNSSGISRRNSSRWLNWASQAVIGRG